MQPLGEQRIRVCALDDVVGTAHPRWRAFLEGVAEDEVELLETTPIRERRRSASAEESTRKGERLEVLV